MQLIRDEIRQIVVLAVLCGFLFFFGLANFGLLGADEPRYAQIGREMLERNDWVTPRLHGEVWLEKPVLYYWLEMVAYRLFGVSDWAARLPAAVLGAILIAGIYGFIRRFRPGAQMEAAIIAASSIAVFGFARGVSTDVPLAVFFSLGLLSWWTYAETDNRNWLLVFYSCMALATLAKGPVAVLLGAAVIGIFVLATRDGRLLLRSLWLPGLAVFCVLALPWYMLVQLRNPQFYSEFILNHNLARFSTDAFRHARPFWYFVPVLFVGLLPWTAFGIAGAVHAFRRWRDRYLLFLLLWAVFPVIFFSLSQSKLPGYILPAIPAWALLAVEYLQSRFREQKKIPTALLVTHGLASAVMVAAVALLPRFMLDRHGRLSGWIVLVTVSIAALTFLFVAGLGLWRETRLLRFVTLIPLLFCVAYVLRLAAPAVDASQSARPVAKSFAGITTPIAVFKLPRALEYGLGFYRNQPIARYERGEVLEQEHFLLAPQNQEKELAAALKDWKAKQPARNSENSPNRGCKEELVHALLPAGEFKPQAIRYYRVHSAFSTLCLSFQQDPFLFR